MKIFSSGTRKDGETVEMSDVRISLEELANRVGCSSYPKRWEEIYGEVMEEYERNGTPLTCPEYYEKLHDEYGILENDLELYCQVALLVGKDEYLSRFLALLVAALAYDASTVKEELWGFSQPKKADGSHDLATDMLTALAICSQIPRQYEILKKRGIPEQIIRSNLKSAEKGVANYAKKNNGAKGYALLAWNQLAVNGCLFRIGRLEIEMFAKFSARAKVFSDGQGRYVTLAHDLAVHESGNALGSAGFSDDANSFTAYVTESDEEYVGHPFDERGKVIAEALILKKSQWSPVLEYGDSVVGLHIPADGRLEPSDVDDTLIKAREFIAEYFPDFKYKAFYCRSWLLDPQLEDLLGADSNIVRFGKRFCRQTSKSEGNGIFSFVFTYPNARDDLTALPENTRLTRTLKAHYLDGKYIYETCGYFFHDPQ